MNLFVSRVLSIIKLTHYLYPYVHSDSPTNAFSQTEGRLKKQRGLKVISPHTPHFSHPSLLNKFLKDKFNIDNIKQQDPGLYKQIKKLLLIVNACLAVCNQNSLEKRITLLVDILKNCDELIRESLQLQTEKTPLETLQNNSIKIKLRSEILLSIHYLAIIFRKTLGNTLNLTITFIIVQAIEKDYCAAVAAKKPIFKANPEECSFWDSLGDILIPLIEQAHQNFFKRNPHILKILNTTLSTSDVPDIKNPQYAHRLAKKLISKMRKINYINNLTQHHHGEFLKHFYHGYHPLKSFGGVCVGAVAEWGVRLKKGFAKKLTPADPFFPKYNQWLHCLKAEKYPDILLASYSWLGESLFNKNILLFHLHFTKLFREYKIDSFEYPNAGCEGMQVANAVFELLKKVNNPAEPISVIGITLEATNKAGATINNAAFQPHMMAIAKIALKDKVVYRFMDTDFGEFQFTSPIDLTNWLQEYFQLCHYNCKFNRFSLQPMDAAINKHLGLHTDQNILFLLKEHGGNPAPPSLASLSASDGLLNASSSTSPKPVSPTALAISSQQLMPIATPVKVAGATIIPLTRTLPSRSPLLLSQFQNFMATHTAGPQSKTDKKNTRLVPASQKKPSFQTSRGPAVKKQGAHPSR
jgi:hypothetical protein